MILLAALLAAASPTEIAAVAPPSAWRAVAPENLLLLETARGTMAIELAPDFAPAHIAAIKALVAAGQFDGGAITRVQDNYVVQWAARPFPAKAMTANGAAAMAAGAAATPGGAVPGEGTKPAPLPAEYERPAKGLAITPLGSTDAYAESGFWNGWPVARDRKSGTAWLAHCYASVGVGRNNPPDTGDGSELYAVIGHGPRHLDRNITVVGRVIDGIAGYSSLPRGTADLGFYQTPAEQTPITRVRLASTFAGAPRYEVLDSASPAFAAYLKARANRTGFFVRPAGATDLCNVQVPVRRNS
ncbi:MAG: peptidylprolyl isomerase [Polymorphobacter sp.]